MFDSLQGMITPRSNPIIAIEQKPKDDFMGKNLEKGKLLSFAVLKSDGLGWMKNLLNLYVILGI